MDKVKNNQYEGVKINIDKFITRYLYDMQKFDGRYGKLTNESLIDMNCPIIVPLPFELATRNEEMIAEGKIIFVIDKKNITQAYLSPYYLKMYLENNYNTNKIINKFERKELLKIKEILFEMKQYSGGKKHVKKYKRR